MRAREVFADVFECVLESGATCDLEFADKRLELFAGLVDVGYLRDQPFVAFLKMLFFVDRIQIDVAKLLDARPEFSDFLLRRLAVECGSLVTREIFPKRELN